MSYKLIACDLDETLLSADRTVCKRNREAIAKAAQKGVRFVCATGRGFKSIEPTLKELNQFDKENEFAVSFNGGAIIESKDNRILRFEGLDFDKAQELYFRGLKYDVCIHVYTQDEVYVKRIHESERAYNAGRMHFVEFDEDNLDFLRDQAIAKVLFVNTDYDYLKTIEKDLEEITGNLDVSFSSNRYIEFNPKGVNKGSGLLWLADYLNIKPEETIAIGDNFNDLAMIKAAGLGVGVANTIEPMKPECDVITKASCEQGAVAEVIENYILSDPAYAYNSNSCDGPVNKSK